MLITILLLLLAESVIATCNPPSYNVLGYSSEHLETYSGEKVIASSDLALSQQRIWIVTTASLPWMTGTAINPLLRAAELTSNRENGAVTLVVPYVEPKGQRELLQNSEDSHYVLTEAEQEQGIRNWLKEAGKTNAANRLRILFYPAYFSLKLASLFPFGNISKLMVRHGASKKDICILEEPERLSLNPAHIWMERFNHVLGVVHTNIPFYVLKDVGILLQAPLHACITFVHMVVCRANAHRIIKLSAILQTFASEKEIVCNVHGVRAIFFNNSSTPPSSMQGAYFIGKCQWEKGFRHLIRLFQGSQQLKLKFGGSSSSHPVIHIYGNGQDRRAIEKTAQKEKLPFAFFDGVDHANLKNYRILVNPSISEVLCTTVAEALAMGKWVVIARHPSNEFFYQFPSCLTFSCKDSKEFAACIMYALRHDPPPLSDALRSQLSWKDATERLKVASLVRYKDLSRRREWKDSLCRVLHATIGPSIFHVAEMYISQRGWI
eukprot:281875_1